MRYEISDELIETIVAALNGDSNDAEHEALYEVACDLGLDWRINSEGD